MKNVAFQYQTIAYTCIFRFIKAAKIHRSLLKEPRIEAFTGNLLLSIIPSVSTEAARGRYFHLMERWHGLTEASNWDRVLLVSILANFKYGCKTGASTCLKLLLQNDYQIFKHDLVMIILSFDVNWLSNTILSQILQLSKKTHPHK